MKQTKVILLSLLLFSLFPFIRADNGKLPTPELINKLHQGDDSVIPVLKQRQAEVLKLLKNPAAAENIQKLLQELGSETFTTREEATVKLTQMGPAVFPAVRSHLEKNMKDPEIKIRCQTILHAKPSSKQQSSLIQTVKFLITINDLDEATIDQFEKAYREYFTNYQNLPDNKKPEQQELLDFIRQFVQIKGTEGQLADWLKAQSSNTFNAVAPVMLEKAMDRSLPVLLENTRRLSEITKLMLGGLKGKINEGQWVIYIKKLSSLKYIDHGLLRIIKENKNDLPGPLRKNAPMFLNSRPYALQILGLYLYQGDWQDIKGSLQEIFLKKMTDDNDKRNLDSALYELKVPPEGAYTILEVIAETSIPKFPGRCIVPLAKQADKLPKELILSKIKKSPSREKWAEILSEHYPELKPMLQEMLFDDLKSTGDADEFNAFQQVLKNNLGYDFKPGELDNIWHKLILKNKDSYTCLFDCAPTVKVSPALLLSEIKKVDEKNEKYSYSQLLKCFKYLLESDDKEIVAGAVDLLSDKILAGKNDYYDRVEFYQYIIDARPETSAKLLLKKAMWFLTNPEAKGHALYYCMFLSPGSHGDNFTDITAFFLKHEVAIVKLLKQDHLNGEDFPFVAIFALNNNLREKYGDLLKKRLINCLPHIKNSPHLQQCAVIAGSALDMKHPELDNTLISLIKRPPKYLHYMDETMLSLGKNQAHLIPQLLEMDKKTEKAPFPFDTAIFIDSNDPELIKYGENLLLKNESHVIACNAALALAIVGKMPPLHKIPRERISWFLKISKDDLPNTEKFLDSFENAGEEKELLKMLIPSFRKIAELQSYDPGLTNLFWKKPDNQKIVIGEIVGMMESDNDKHRTLAYRLLASAPLAAVDHIDRIHACLKKEKDIQRRQNLLWAIANIGTAAAPMQETVKAIHDSENHVVFCLANISAAPEERKKYLLQLIKKFKEKPDSTTVRMIGLVKDQTDITRPFLKQVIHQVIEPEPEKEKKLYSYIASEGIWGLSRGKPADEIFRTYVDILKKAGSDRFTITDDIVSAALWSLRVSYPERLPECREIIENLPFRFRISKSYRRTVEKLKGK